MKGMTLLEVIIALAILAMMSLAIYGGASRTVSHQEKLADQSERLRGANLALWRMSRDLKTAYIVKSREMLGAQFDGELAFVGKEDRIDFVSFANLRYIRDAKESDSLELSYYLESDPDNSESYILMRRQSTEIDKNISEGGKAYPLLKGVKSVHFEYLAENSEEWLREWDSASLKENNQIPRAIKVDLEVYYPTSKEETTFSVIVRPEMTKPLAI